MYSKKEKRFYERYYPEDGRKAIFSVEYTLWFEDDTNKLVEVRNENHEAVEQKSEVWAFFNDKYNDL